SLPVEQIAEDNPGRHDRADPDDEHHRVFQLLAWVELAKRITRRPAQNGWLEQRLGFHFGVHSLGYLSRMCVRRWSATARPPDQGSMPGKTSARQRSG